MKFLSTLIVVLALAFGGWTYYNLYELTAALIEKNDRELALRVNLESIQAQYALEHSQPFTPRNLPPGDPIERTTEEQPKRAAVETVIDMEWVRDTIARPANGRISWPDFAFFESPTRLLIRYGNLGDGPVHAYMSLKDWQWHLSEIYE